MRKHHVTKPSRPLAPHEKHDRQARLLFLDERMKALNMIEEMSDENFVWAVRAVVNAGLAQKELALALGVNQSTISRWTREKDPQLPPHLLTREGCFRRLKQEFGAFIASEKAAGQDEPSHARPGRVLSHG
jgi:hypothetical protein